MAIATTDWIEASDWQYSPWFLLLVGAGTLVLLTSYGYQRKKLVNLPPGPWNWPLIGALLEMDPRMHKAFENLATKYGPIVYFRLGVQEVVLLSSAEAAEELLKERDVDFADRSTAMTRTSAKYTGFESCVMPFANYDAQLKLLRKISITEFFTGAKLKSYEELRRQEVAVMVEKITNASKPSNSKDGDQNNPYIAAAMGIRSEAAAVAVNVIFRLCFGKRFDGLPPTDPLQKFPQLTLDLVKLFMAFNLVDYFPFLEWLDPQGLVKEFKKIEKRLKDFYGGIVENHRQARKLNRELKISSNADEGNSKNFVDVLLRLQEEGGQISDNAVMATVLTVLSAGIHTTSSQVEWVLLELARHPEIVKRLQVEIDAVVGKERAVQEFDLQAMPFLNAVMMESLRLHPTLPFTFPHVNMKPSTLCGYHIPAKTAVIVNTYSIGRDPKFWANPLDFKPDRFMPGGSSADPSRPSDSMRAGGSDYHLLPFGSGRRICIGVNLAMVLMLRTVATLVHAFDWGAGTSAVTTDEGGSFILHPKSDLLLRLAPRLAPHVYQSNIPQRYSN